MLPGPVAVVRQAQVAHRCVRTQGPLDRQGQRLRPLGGGYVAPVTVGLLDVVLAPVLDGCFGRIKTGVAGDGAEIDGRQE